VRRGGRRDGTIAISADPNPPCITMSLPSYAPAGAPEGKPSEFLWMRRTSLVRGVSLPDLVNLTDDVVGDSSLWHWSYCAFTGYPRSDGCYPHGVPLMSGRSSHLRSLLAALVELRWAGTLRLSCDRKSRGLPSVALGERKRTRSVGGRSPKGQIRSISDIRLLDKEML